MQAVSAELPDHLLLLGQDKETKAGRVQHNAAFSALNPVPLTPVIKSPELFLRVANLAILALLFLSYHL